MKAVYNHFVFSQNEYLSRQLSNIEMQADLFKKKDRKIWTIRHDLLNQLTIINGYLESGDVEECRKVIRDEIGELNQMPVWTDTGYAAIDAIISTKFSIAKENADKTKSGIQIGRLSVELEYDIALILSNLLDNAIENISSKQKEICLKMKSGKESVISITNTTDQKELTLNTNKIDTRNHGLGLNSVQLLAKKHHGFLITGLQDGIFTAVVTLKSE